MQQRRRPLVQICSRDLLSPRLRPLGECPDAFAQLGTRSALDTAVHASALLALFGARWTLPCQCAPGFFGRVFTYVYNPSQKERRMQYLRHQQQLSEGDAYVTVDTRCA